MRTLAKSSRCASMSEAIASRIEWQLHACATPQRPPPSESPPLLIYYEAKVCQK